MIMGAGSVLDINFPCGVLKPSTWNITTKVREPYSNIWDDEKPITIVEDIYQILIRNFPVNKNLWWEKDQQPNIHFEILFHVMEQLLAYESVWSGNNYNPDIFPHFAPFTAQGFKFEREDLRQIMWPYILRIMDIVNSYNEYFRNDNRQEDWYREFFKGDFSAEVSCDND